MTHRAHAEPLRPSAELPSDGPGYFLRGGEAVIDLDVAFDLLSNRRRRIVLHYLRDAGDEWVAVRDLAEHVAAWEVELADPDSVSVASIELDLVHAQLPRLAAADVIDCDEGGRRVAYRGAARVDRLLDFARSEGPLP